MNYYDAIIFDLDGTLWQTRDSYLYAYHMVLASHKEIKEVHSDEQVLNTMGNTLDIVANVVFSNEDLETKINLMKECLYHSCMYLLKNESTLYPNVQKTLIELSKKTKLFIVSNCPKEYVDVFFQKSNTSDIFIDYRYLTDSSTKESNINELIEKYDLKSVLMVGDSNDDFKAIKDKNIEFVYASYGYKECQNYDYKIKDFSELNKIISTANYEATILRNASYFKVLKYNDAKITIMKNNNQIDSDYLFGFWHFSEAEENNFKLFEILEETAKTLDAKELLGPIDYTTWFNYRLAIDNFDWRLYPDIYNDFNQVNFLEKNGYIKKYTYASLLSTIDYNLWNKCKKIKIDDGIKSIVVHKEEAFNYIKDIYEISIDCFQKAYLYSPITFDDFKDLYLENIKLVDPDIVILYSKDEPIAFSFCYEDINKKYYVSKTVGIKSKFQNRKLILRLIDESYKMMEEKKYSEVLYHFQNEQKHILTSVWKNTIIKRKRYALFHKVL